MNLSLNWIYYNTFLTKHKPKRYFKKHIGSQGTRYNKVQQIPLKTKINFNNILCNIYPTTPQYINISSEHFFQNAEYLSENQSV